ncbi:c-type cytochrome [Acerihabitans arboris]|uniref:C-type cytochrome n=1 Tax=Acerihabitans arboris TaxID=2691583 RepID=A0A845SWK8_9GAMM|nr:c-type cytochrome [Acerihabitans arboris]NDL65275.1 c-type cytochrome [Acerihabitans arboris]
MKRLIVGVLVICISGTALADASDAAKKYAQGCADCHGRKADRAAFGKAPPLVSLSREQLVGALTDRRDGKVATSGAAQRAKTALTDEDIQGLAGYIRSLAPGADSAAPAVAN